MSLFKLAVRNVRRSVRDYAVYFLTLMLGVCIYYLFGAMDSQALVQGLSGIQKDIIQNMVQMLSIVSVLVTIILACLVIYANKYLVKRRKKELGLYMLLGMEKRKISMVLVLETTLIGILSLAVGLALGILLSQGLSVVVSTMFEVQYGEFQFVFSSSAFWRTILCFVGMFLLVMLFNIGTVSRCKLIDLLNAGRKNEEIKTRRLGICVAIFLASLVCLAAAYYLIITTGIGILSSAFTWSIVLGIVGTVLFFMSLSGFLLRLCKGNKKLYYRNLNMFVLRQLNSKINTAYISISMVCIMLFFSIVISATALGFNAAMTKDVENTAPFSVTMQGNDGEGTSMTGYVQYLEERNFPTDEVFERSYEYTYHRTDITYGQLFMGIEDSQYTRVRQDTPAHAIALSDYNALMEMQERQPLKLRENEFAVMCMQSLSQEIMKRYVAQPQTVEIQGRVLRLGSSELIQRSLETTYQNRYDIVLVLPDDLTAMLPADYTYLAVNYPMGDESYYDEKLSEGMSNVNIQDGDEQWYIATRTRSEIYFSETGSKVLVLFVLAYLGVIFLIVSAALLALQQLTEAADNTERYRLLSKIGVDRRMLSHSILTQVAIYFFIPLALAIVHAAVGIYVTMDAIQTMSNINSLGSILGAGGLILFIYLAYFCATYFGCRSTLKQIS